MQQGACAGTRFQFPNFRIHLIRVLCLLRKEKVSVHLKSDQSKTAVDGGSSQAWGVRELKQVSHGFICVFMATVSGKKHFLYFLPLTQKQWQLPIFDCILLEISICLFLKGSFVRDPVHCVSHTLEHTPEGYEEAPIFKSCVTTGISGTISQ
jgi:hypothetical protein